LSSESRCRSHCTCFYSVGKKQQHKKSETQKETQVILELIVGDLIDDGRGLLEHVQHRLAIHPLGSGLLVLLEQLFHFVLLVEGLDQATRRNAEKMGGVVDRKREMKTIRVLQVQLGVVNQEVHNGLGDRVSDVLLNDSQVRRQKGTYNLVDRV